MKINIWIKVEEVEVLNDIIEACSVGPFLRKKYKAFVFSTIEPGPVTLGETKLVEVSISFDTFIQIRDNFECI